MAKMKDSRWYKVVDNDMVEVYDSPYVELATFVSIVDKADLTYYRKTFNLKKVV